MFRCCVGTMESVDRLVRIIVTHYFHSFHNRKIALKHLNPSQSINPLVGHRYTSRRDARDLFVQSELDLVDDNLDLVREYWRCMNDSRRADIFEEMCELYPERHEMKTENLWFLNFLRGRIDTNAMNDLARARREQSVRDRLTSSISVSPSVKTLLEFYPNKDDDVSSLMHLFGFETPSPADLRDIENTVRSCLASYLQNQLEFQAPPHSSQFENIISIVNKFADRRGNISTNNFPKAIQTMYQNKQIHLTLPDASTFVQFATSVFLGSETVSKERFVRMLASHSLRNQRKTKTSFLSILTHLRATYKLETKDVDMQVRFREYSKSCHPLFTF